MKQRTILKNERTRHGCDSGRARTGVSSSAPIRRRVDNTRSALAPQDDPTKIRSERVADPVDRAVRLLFLALDAEREGRHGAVASAQFEFIAITEANGPLFGKSFMPRAARALAERLPGLPFEACEAMLGVVMRRLFTDSKVRELSEPRGHA